MKQLVVFDLDGTLAPSKSKLEAEDDGLEKGHILADSGGQRSRLRRRARLGEHNRG